MITVLHYFLAGYVVINVFNCCFGKVLCDDCIILVLQ